MTCSGQAIMVRCAAVIVVQHILLKFTCNGRYCRCRVTSSPGYALPGRQHRNTGACSPCAASNKVTDAGWEGIAGSVGVGILWAALACESYTDTATVSSHDHVVIVRDENR